MRAMGIRLASVFLMVAATATAQQSAPSATAETMKTFASSSDVKALIAKAKSERKDGQPLVAEPLFVLPPYTAHLEYRASVGNAAVHEKEAELFYVIEGTATMVTGGTLAGQRRTDATNLTGTSIQGGSSRTVAKGDFIIVPENTPHWFSKINGAIVLMTLHVPRA